MSIINDERLIKKTSKGWYAVLESNKKADSLNLTNKRIIIGDSNNFISLDDILDIDIETQFGYVPKIKITCNDRTECLEFFRTSAGHIAAVFGEVSFAHSEVSAYTAYWASILTMTAYLYGQNYGKEKEVIYEERRAWCGDCKKYVKIPYSDIPVWKTKCPICGNSGMTSLSPEDRKKEGEKNRFIG